MVANCAITAGCVSSKLMLLAVLVARRGVAVGGGPDLAPFFHWRAFDRAAAGPDDFLEEPDQEADGAGDHEDDADRVDGDALDVDVGRELEDRSDRDYEDSCSDGHGAWIPRVWI